MIRGEASSSLVGHPLLPSSNGSGIRLISGEWQFDTAWEDSRLVAHSAERLLDTQEVVGAEPTETTCAAG